MVCDEGLGHTRTLRRRSECRRASRFRSGRGRARNEAAQGTHPLTGREGEWGRRPAPQRPAGVWQRVLLGFGIALVVQVSGARLWAGERAGPLKLLAALVTVAAPLGAAVYSLVAVHDLYRGRVPARFVVIIAVLTILCCAGGVFAILT